MRIPMNYIEQLPIIVFLSLISGLYFALTTNIIVWVMLLGRIIYSIGYNKEPMKRVAGAIIGLIGGLALVFLSIISASAYLNNSY